MRMRDRLAAMLLFTALPLGATQAAGLTGINVGVGVWNQSPSGHVQSEGNRADVEDDLRVDSDTQVFFWADFRHPVPLIPRVKLQHTPVDLSGDGRVRNEFSFGDVTVGTDNDVRADVEFDQTDFIIYWTPWSLLADVDLGLNIKYIDGVVDVRDRTSGESDRISYSGPLPMLYGRVEVGVPGTGFYGGGEGSFLAYSGHRILDVTLRGGYRASFGPAALGVEAGWKRQEVRLDDFDDLDADFTLEGPYLGVSAHF